MAKKPSRPEEYDHVSGMPRHDLPAAYAREIGRIVVAWARFDYLARVTLWATLDLSAPEGRLAARALRPADALGVISALLALRGASWDQNLCADLKKRAAALKTERDLLAHGIWDNISGEWAVEESAGEWAGEAAEAFGTTKKVTAEFVRRPLSHLSATVAEIEALITDFRRLRDSASGPPRPSRGRS